MITAPSRMVTRCGISGIAAVFRFHILPFGELPVDNCRFRRGGFLRSRNSLEPPYVGCQLIIVIVSVSSFHRLVITAVFLVKLVGKGIGLFLAKVVTTGNPFIPAG